ncbi:MAG: hypothetical protein ACFE7R_08825, partial [Candidatus Hodarchaeota archaeon]
HPAPEYCQLQNGLLIAAKFTSGRNLQKVIDWLTIGLPFVNVRYDLETGDMVAVLRLPITPIHLITGPVTEMLEEESDGYTAATIRERKGYSLTAFSRLYETRSKPWLDPWR